MLLRNKFMNVRQLLHFNEACQQCLTKQREKLKCKYGKQYSQTAKYIGLIIELVKNSHMTYVCNIYIILYMLSQLFYIYKRIVKKIYIYEL